jgi:hypothetical protein
MIPAVAADAATSRRDRPWGAWLPLACALAIMLCTFSMPGRETPKSFAALDPIALTKAAVRMGSLALLGLRFALAFGDRRWRAILFVLAPFGAFAAWATFSTAWSALPTVSLGQALGLFVLLLLAANVALDWRGEADTSAALAALSVGMLAMSAVAAGAHLVAPDEMGLNRGELVTEGDPGLIHPSTAAGTAGLGIVILFAALMLWGWAWARLLLFPGCAVHAAVLVLAASRTPAVVTAAVLGLMFCAFLPRGLLAGLVLLASVAGVGYLTLDPGGRLIDQGYHAVAGHFQRGDTEESLSSFSGRTDLWEIIWQDFLASPLVGNGYFVTTRTGNTDVWGEDSNLTAHNLPLQVLSTTGLVGAALFVVAVGHCLIVLGRGLWQRAEPRHFRLMAVFCLWNVGQGVLSEAFMGGLYPEPVAAFVALGIAIGAVLAHRQADAEGERP